MTTDPTVLPDDDGWFITQTSGPMSQGGTEEMVVFRGPRPVSPRETKMSTDHESKAGSGPPEAASP